jgi:uncharacterized membrane protein YdbT with pleckstrin-like domain
VRSTSKLLGADEQLVLRTRTHGKALVRPSIGLILLGGAVGAGVALVPSAYRPVGQLLIGVGALAVILWLVVLPFLRWWTTTYTLTTRRLVTRRGIVHRIGRDLPLIRVNDFTVDRGLLDRIFGSGTIRVQTSVQHGVLVLVDVPEVERVQAAMAELLFDALPAWDPAG